MTRESRVVNLSNFRPRPEHHSATRIAFSLQRRTRTSSVFIPRSRSQQANGSGAWPQTIIFLSDFIDVGRRPRDYSAQNVVMTVEILGGRVNDDVGAVLISVAR